jgi:radical SAM superfamily enzyme
VILGLPGESREDMLATADALAGLPVHAVKIHNLHVVKDTPLEKMYERGEARMFERDEYVQIVCDFLERLRPDMVIHRLSGDAPPDYLVAPLWCLDKPALLRAIHDELERRDSWPKIRHGVSAYYITELPLYRGPWAAVDKAPRVEARPRAWRPGSAIHSSSRPARPDRSR